MADVCPDLPRQLHHQRGEPRVVGVGVHELVHQLLGPVVLLQFAVGERVAAGQVPPRGRVDVLLLGRGVAHQFGDEDVRDVAAALGRGGGAFELVEQQVDRPVVSEQDVHHVEGLVRRTRYAGGAHDCPAALSAPLPAAGAVSGSCSCVGSRSAAGVGRSSSSATAS